MAETSEKSLKLLVVMLYSPTASAWPSLYQTFPEASMASICAFAVPIGCSLTLMVPVVVAVKLPSIVLPFSANQTVLVVALYTMPYGSLEAVGRAVSTAVCEVVLKKPILFPVASVNQMFPCLSTTMSRGTEPALMPILSVALHCCQLCVAFSGVDR